MKKKLLRLCVPALILLAVIGMTSFASGDETSNHWNTTLCIKNVGDTTYLSSACKNPDKNGPCDRQTDCQF